jgi:FlaA1/EpsC-like NDP-sugar epimerase
MAFKAVFDGVQVWIYSGIFCIFFAMVPTLLRRYADINIPWKLEFLLFLALFLHVGGGALGMYNVFWTWDMVTHFVSTFMLALIGFILFFIVNERLGFMKLNARKIILITMVIAMSLGLIWEGMEIAADMLVDLRAADDINDTMLDLVMDVVGGMAAALLAVRWHRDGTLQRTSSEFGSGMDGLFDWLASIMKRPVTQ